MAKLAVIDLAEFSHPNQKKNLLEAARHWGCFHVINHGIPGALQSDMNAAVMKCLFNLPDDVKRRNADVMNGSGYMGPSPQYPLYETFALYDAASASDVDVFFSLLDAPIHVRATIKKYVEKFHEETVDVATKLAESMGLKDQNFGDWPCQFKINKYNFTENSLGSDGAPAHTDSGFLTLLHVDEHVGGLEIWDPQSGSYVEVDPLPGSLLVNLGDVAQAWSNGALHNVKHRVKCMDPTQRFSIALFLLAPKDGKVEAPAALIDSDHPRMYQTFQHDDYRKLRVSRGLCAGEALSQLLM